METGDPYAALIRGPEGEGDFSSFNILVLLSSLFTVSCAAAPKKGNGGLASSTVWEHHSCALG